MRTKFWFTKWVRPVRRNGRSREDNTKTDLVKVVFGDTV
jgi:hypothetical protein